MANADDLAKTPEDTSCNTCICRRFGPCSHFERARCGGQHESLQTASRFDLGVGGIGVTRVIIHPIYVRGHAYLAAKQRAKAAAEFQRILDHRSIVLVDPVDALARLQLARALALSGETVKAKRGERIS